MFPPHESDVAQLPCPPADAGPCNRTAPPSPPRATAAEEQARWQVIGDLPHAIPLPPPITGPAAASATCDWAPVASADASAAVSAAPPMPAIASACAGFVSNPPSSVPAASAPLYQPEPAATVTGAAPSASAASDGSAEPSQPRRRSRLGEVPCWLVSLVVHLTALVVLALVPGWWDAARTGLVTSLQFEETPHDSLIDGDEPQIEEVDLTSLDAAESQIVESAETEEIFERIGMEDDLLAADVEEFAMPNAADAMLEAASAHLLTAAEGGDLGGRGALARADLVRFGGGSAASEEAVALALKWIVAHQAKDGGWNFNHRQGTTCMNRCGQPGSSRMARNGATAMALLPLLGAGNTHKAGRYRENVDRGLRFLLSRQDAKTGSWHEPQGDMYSHGLAAIALCEAYAMTKDRELREAAQNSLDFITFAQDPVGGGWRYAPRQAGDTSVVGWQMMALKSGLMGYLKVSPDTVKLAEKFLDHVQDGDGSQYGYTNSGGGPATTSIGLLCRMYLGWGRDHPALVRGVEYLGKTGPSGGNMYYNYYATQVVHHYGGEVWKKWNAQMRDSLVNSQEKQGHAAGSWLMQDRFVGQGGRLYCTALAAMILEVYYRHLPIYRQESVKERFYTPE